MMRRIFFLRLTSGLTMSTETDLALYIANHVPARTTLYLGTNKRVKGMPGRVASPSWPMMGIVRPANGHYFGPKSSGSRCEVTADRSVKFNFTTADGRCGLSRGAKMCVELLRAGLDFLPTLGAPLRIEDLFSEANGFRSDLDEFIVSDKFDGLFQGHVPRRNQTNGLVGGGRAHIGLLLFFGDVDVHIVFARIFADDHSFIDFDRGADEHLAAFLNSPDGVGGRNAGTIANQCASKAHGHVSGIFGPTLEQ